MDYIETVKNKIEEQLTNRQVSVIYSIQVTEPIYFDEDETESLIIKIEEIRKLKKYKTLFYLPFLAHGSQWYGFIMRTNPRNDQVSVKVVDRHFDSKINFSDIKRKIEASCSDIIVARIEYYNSGNKDEDTDALVKKLISEAKNEPSENSGRCDVNIDINNMTDDDSSDGRRTEEDQRLTNATISKARMVRASHDEQYHLTQELHNCEQIQTISQGTNSVQTDEQRALSEKTWESKQSEKVSTPLCDEKNKRILDDNYNMGPLRLDFIDLYTDYKLMADCFERIMLRLICYAHYRHRKGASLTLPEVIHEFESDIDTLEQINLLKNRLEIEQIQGLGLNNELTNVKTLFDERNWHGAQKCLETIWLKICPLNLNEIFRLVKRTDDAAHLIKGKNIILFLGGTGTGKSTTIHFLGGSTMCEVEEFNLPHIKPVEVRNADLLKITTTPISRSETRYLTAVRIDPNDVPELNEDEIILCDSPGFEDTNGPEVDIANGIGIIKAIQNSKSVKPVVLISYMSMGDRLGGIKDLAHLLTKFIPNIKSHMKAFSYIFTKCPDNRKGHINKMLIDVKQHINEKEKADLAFVSFISDMISKTRKSFIALDPLKDDRIDIFTEILQSQSISRPNEVFHFSITEKSTAIVQEQVRKDQMSIMHATKRAEYAFVNYKLSQMKKFCDLILQENITRIYTETIDSIVSHLSKEYENAQESIDRYFRSTNPITEDDLSKFNEFYRNALAADELRNVHFGSHIVNSDAYMINLKEEVKQLMNDFDKSETYSVEMKLHLDKLKKVEKLFPNLDMFKYENCCTRVQKKLEDTFNSFQNNLQHYNFDEDADSFAKFHCASEYLKDHIDTRYIEEPYVKMKQMFSESLGMCSKVSNNILSNAELNEQDVQLLSTWLSRLELVRSMKAFESVISKPSVDILHDGILSNTVNYFNKIVLMIKETLSKRDGLDAIEKKMSQLNLIQKIPGLESRTAQSYFSTLEAIIATIHESRRDVENNIKAIFQGEGRVNYECVLESLKVLTSGGWIESYRKGVYSNVIASLQKMIVQFIDQEVRDLSEFSLTLEDVENIDPVWKKLSELNKLKQLDTYFPGIKEPILENLKIFQREIDSVCDIMIDSFDVKTSDTQDKELFDWVKADKSLYYLSVCCKHRLISLDKVTHAQMILRRCIEYTVNQMNGKIQSSFESIQSYPKVSQETLAKAGRILSKYLEEIYETVEHHHHVFKYFARNDIVEVWKKDLSDFRNELADQMREKHEQSNIAELNHKLAIAKTLSKVDFLLEDKFIELHATYKIESTASTNEISQKVLFAIKNRDYEIVSIEMATLRNSGDLGKNLYDRTRRHLKIDVENLVEETNHQAILIGNELNREKIEPISMNLKLLKKANQYLSEHLDDKTQVTACIEKVTQKIEYQIECSVNGVKALINAENISEAERNIKSLTLVSDILGTFCSEKASTLIHGIRASQSKVVLEDIPERYAKMELQQYMLRPPTDIFNKFNQADATNPIYANALEKITQNILDKFRSKLNEAKELKPPNPDNIYIRQFESALNFLPEGMKSLLDGELKYAIEEITKSGESEQKRFADVLKSENPALIKKNLVDYNNSMQTKEYLTKMRSEVSSQVDQIVSNMEEALVNNSHTRLFEHFAKLHQYSYHLEDDIGNIREIFSKMRTKIIQRFYETAEYFHDRLLGNTSRDVNENELNLTEISFSFVIDFMKFVHMNKNSDNSNKLVDDTLPENFESTSEEFTKKTIGFFKSVQNDITLKLESSNLTTIGKSLDTLRRWDRLFMKLRQRLHSYSSINDSVRTMKEVIEILPSYSQAVNDFQRKIDSLIENLRRSKTADYETKNQGNQKSRIYRELNDQIMTLYDIRKLESHFSREILLKNFDEFQSEFTETTKNLFDETYNLLPSVLKEKNLNSRIFDRFNANYEHLLSIHTEIKMVKTNTDKYIHQIEEEFTTKFETWQKDAIDFQKIEDVARILIDMKRIVIRIILLKDKLNRFIDETLTHLQRNFKGTNNFNKVGYLLNVDQVGASIVSDSPIFKGYSTSIFIEKTRRHDINYVLNNIKGDKIDKVLLRARYDEFNTEYKRNVALYLKPDVDTSELISNIILKTGDIKQETGNLDWDGNCSLIPELAGKIFAVWTLQNAQFYFEAVGDDKRADYLFQPHAAQVIAIFRILGIGVTEETLENSLVQIGTGEGKSITLGILAVLLALFGFDVFCACYSEYLSKRDYEAFSSLFTALGIVNHIHYGTFDQLCEDVINIEGNIRQIVEESILKNSIVTQSTSKRTARPKILLIDEVDVFFNSNFYGNVYTPCARLKDPLITDLVNFIWQNRKSNLTLSKVKDNDVYKNCCGKFSNWIKLIDEAVKSMIGDVTSFESHDYIVKDDKIGYVEQDKVAYNILFGYKTLFAYYAENEKGIISQSGLSDQISLQVECGHFSYAEIPHQFEFILGVTGTLETLSDPEKKIIREDYHIAKETFMPSVFGKNQLKFEEGSDIKIENNEDFFNTIMDEIENRLPGSSGGKRAVLVVFETREKLKEFRKSKSSEKLRNQFLIINEDTPMLERDSLIKRATTSGQITLLTRMFGRGTDFVCHDAIVAQNGGVHVIQTFLSEERSEEKQIKGRTARQGEYGSYCMILLDSDLEKFLIYKEDIDKLKRGEHFFSRIWKKLVSRNEYKNIYAMIDDHRNTYFKRQYKTNSTFVKDARKSHQQAMQFLSVLLKSQMNEVQAYLIKQNKGPEFSPKSRTIVLMDATGSMASLLLNCKITVGTMFQRASEVLGESADVNQAFELQFAVYRNYNSEKDKILQSSPWETKADKLWTFLNAIQPEGGWGNEAIEIGLWHANREHKHQSISQVILIGDAPPNTSKEVSGKRDYLKEDYWKNSRFSEKTYYQDELKKLAENGIRIHAFYVDERAKTSFSGIAIATGGRCEALDIHSPEKGAEMLTNLVTEEILRNVGGDKQGKALVEAYRKKYSKIYA